MVRSEKLQTRCKKLVQEKKVLLGQLGAEKKASNTTTNQSMAETRNTMAKAVSLIDQASELKKQAETAALDDKLKHSDIICKERSHTKARSNRLKDRHKLWMQEHLAKIKDKHVQTVANLEAKWKKAKTRVNDKVRTSSFARCKTMFFPFLTLQIISRQCSQAQRAT